MHSGYIRYKTSRHVGSNACKKNIKQSDSTIKVLLLSTFEILENEFSIVLPSIKVDGFIQKQVSQISCLNIVNKVTSLDEDILSSKITLHERT